MSQTKQQGLITKTCRNSFFRRMHMASQRADQLNKTDTLYPDDDTKYTILQIMHLGEGELIMELIETELYLGELPFA